MPCQVILVVVQNDSGAFETSVTAYSLQRSMTEHELHIQQRRYENLNCLILYSNLLVSVKKFISSERNALIIILFLLVILSLVNTSIGEV
jgi:hypothetical protein